VRYLQPVGKEAHFTAEEARAVGTQIGIDWATSRFDVEQFRAGMDVELEHGKHDPETNVTDDDVTVTAKIARAHLNEFPDYYSRLAVMEAEAEAYWATQGE
jgi:DNA-directed RNA polymerase alpha subunit